jgi:hypothetical protein
MKQCKECGLPARFAGLFQWRGDGTILMKRQGAVLRLALLDADELQALFDSLSEKIGFSVDHILVEAQRRVGKAIYANRPIPFIKFVPHNRVARPEWALKAAVQFLGRDIAAIGYGVVKVDSYRSGDHLSVRVENACLPPRLVGSFVGATEVVEGVPMTADYRMEGDTLIIDVRRSEEKDRAEEERLYLDKVSPTHGTLAYDRCVLCGAPVKAAKTIRWDRERGMILDRSSGHRDVMFAVQSLNALQRELEAELGEQVRDIMYDTQLDLSRRSPGDLLAGKQGTFWDGFLLGLALRGMGYPDDFDFEDGRVIVEISNAYNQTLYAARIAAAMEARSGRPSAIDWTERGWDKASFTISEA